MSKEIVTWSNTAIRAREDTCVTLRCEEGSWNSPTTLLEKAFQSVALPVLEPNKIYTHKRASGKMGGTPYQLPHSWFPFHRCNGCRRLERRWCGGPVGPYPVSGQIVLSASLPRRTLPACSSLVPYHSIFWTTSKCISVWRKLETRNRSTGRE